MWINCFKKCETEIRVWFYCDRSSFIGGAVQFNSAATELRNCFSPAFLCKDWTYHCTHQIFFCIFYTTSYISVFHPPLSSSMLTLVSHISTTISLLFVRFRIGFILFHWVRIGSIWIALLFLRGFLVVFLFVMELHSFGWVNLVLVSMNYFHLLVCCSNSLFFWLPPPMQPHSILAMH